MLDKPLLVRAEASLASAEIGQLMAEQHATVIEEQISSDGKMVRMGM